MAPGQQHRTIIGGRRQDGHDADIAEAARFFDLAIAELAGMRGRGLRILDFGCGAGVLMRAMTALGYESYGCDVVLLSGVVGSDRVKLIEQRPYRIPSTATPLTSCSAPACLEHTAIPMSATPRSIASSGRAVARCICCPANGIFRRAAHIRSVGQPPLPYADWCWDFGALAGCPPRAKGDPWRQVGRQSPPRFRNQGVKTLTTPRPQARAARISPRMAWPMTFLHRARPRRVCAAARATAVAEALGGCPVEFGWACWCR